jgi:hypothetical protein
MRDLSTIIAIAISFVVIGFYKYERLENADGSSDYTSHIDEWPYNLIIYLGYGQLVTSFSLVIGFCLNRVTIIVKSGWRSKIAENKQKLADDIKFILKPCEPPFGEIRAWDLPL